MIPRLILALWPISPQAFLPPAFHLYQRVAEQRPKTPVHSALVAIARPQSSGTEELLGMISLQDWKAGEGGWPALSLVLGSDETTLLAAVSAFGLKVVPEAALLRVEKEKIPVMKEPPRPYYRSDESISLKRTKQTYAWVHSDKDSGRAVWFEKDSLLPLKIQGPCPAEAVTLPWAKAGSNQCELEFRNLLALRRGSPQSTRMTLWKDGVPLLHFHFERLAAGKARLPAAESTLAPELRAIAEQLLH